MRGEEFSLAEIYRDNLEASLISNDGRKVGKDIEMWVAETRQYFETKNTFESFWMCLLVAFVFSLIAIVLVEEFHPRLRYVVIFSSFIASCVTPSILKEKRAEKLRMINSLERMIEEINLKSSH